MKRGIRCTARSVYHSLQPSRRRFKKYWPAIDKIEGFLVPGQEWWLFKQALDLPPGAVILEIGSFRGRSTACLALGCVGSDKLVYAVDTFNGNDVDFSERDFFATFKSNLDTLGLFKHVRPVISTSSDAAESWTVPIDMLFIDGSHAFDDVVGDFQGFYPHVKEGGLVAFHDVVETWPGVVSCWKEVAEPKLTKHAWCTTIAYGRKRAQPIGSRA
jgi:predicted O-methyltransferase YrrM